jgi:hypothetical protein
LTADETPSLKRIIVGAGIAATAVVVAAAAAEMAPGVAAALRPIAKNAADIIKQRAVEATVRIVSQGLSHSPRLARCIENAVNTWRAVSRPGIPLLGQFAVMVRGCIS